MARGVSVAMIHDIKMNPNEDAVIDRLEFLQYMLVTMGKVSQEDVDKVLGMFDALDEDGSGSLDVEDIKAAERRKKLAAMGGPPAAAPQSTRPKPKADNNPLSAVAAMIRGTPKFLETLKKPLLG